MFGLNKLKEAKEKAQEIKTRLDNTQVEGKSSNGEVNVVCNGNRKVLSISINESIFKIRDQKEVEALVVEATNQALQQAEQLAEAEMRAIMPNIPGL